MLARACHYWASVFGLTCEAFEQPGIRVVAHSQTTHGYHDFEDYHALFALRRGSALRISVPAHYKDQARHRLETLQTLPSFGVLKGLYRTWTQRSVGPAYQGYLEPDLFRPVTSRECRALTPADTPSLERLKAACDPAAWSHSGLAVDDRGLWGCFAGEQLVAAAKPIPWSAGVSNFGILTHPEYRGRGYGAAALSCAVQSALDQGALPVYQTLSNSTAAVKLAQGVGFKRFGESFVLRLATSYLESGALRKG